MVRVWLDIIVPVGIANPKKLLKEREKHQLTHSQMNCFSVEVTFSLYMN